MEKRIEDTVSSLGNFQCWHRWYFLSIRYHTCHSRKEQSRGSSLNNSTEKSRHPVNVMMMTDVENENDNNKDQMMITVL